MAIRRSFAYKYECNLFVSTLDSHREGKKMHRFIICLLIGCVTWMTRTAVAKPTCGPVCMIYCEYGNVLDKNGCPTCECIQPCGADQIPYPNVYCGRGSDSQACPSNHTCTIAPNDSYAVCCPTVSETKKPSCPPESRFGLCTDPTCNVDDDCNAGQICCGSCRRRCVDVYIKQDSSESEDRS